MPPSRRTSDGNYGLPGSYLAKPYGLPAMIDRNAPGAAAAAGRLCLALLLSALAAHGQEPLPASVPARTSVPIHALGRYGGASPYEGKSVQLTGIVTATFPGNAGRLGFHLQTPEGQADGDASTSEAIRVRTGKGASAVAVGDSVQVEGIVNGKGGTLRIAGASVRVLGKGKPLPRPVALRLPFGTLRDPERFEGMRVQFPQTLVVTGNAGWARSRSYAVSPARLLSPTQIAPPGPLVQAARHRDSLARLVVDDDFGWQEHAGVSMPSGLAGRAPLRTGSRVSGLEGILEQRHGKWCLRLTRPPVLWEPNPRPGLPPAKAGTVRVASFNVHNYFTSRGAARACGPTRRKACRGVDDTGEFRHQKAKILAALQALDADIVGLMEIENHATDSALIDLVQGLNASMGVGTWERISTGPLGTDAVKVAMIHRKGRVVPAGDAAFLTRAQDPDFADHKHRVPLAQSFRHSGSGSAFTVVVNHLKSKGSPCPGDPDRGDGQGNCNAGRTLGAEALSRWVAGRPTGAASDETLLIGDFNAYAMEDPIVRLAQRGWVNLVARDQGDSAYSYQYGDAFGTLDYALATPKLAKRARAFTWAINADEPREFSSRQDPYGSSDHDPVVVDLDFLVR